MATRQKMTQVKATTIKTNGAYSCGNNLYLLVRSEGAHKSWIFRYVFENQRNNLSLGSANKVSYSVASAQAYELMKALNERKNPSSLLKAKKTEPVTLEAGFINYLAHKEKVISARHKQDFLRITQFNLVKLMKKPMSQIEVADVVKALTPIWLTKRETADRCLSRVLMVLSHNNIELSKKAILASLPQRLKQVTHLPTIHHNELKPELVRLGAVKTQSSLCLQFIALTALRSATARYITKEMIKGDVIEIPQSLFKGTVAQKAQKEIFRLPVTPSMKAIIHQSIEMQSDNGIATDYLFCNRQGLALSDVAISQIATNNYTPHGLRATFRDWCAENKKDFWASEKQLSHKVLNNTQSSYFRSDLLEERSNILHDYHQYLTATNVVQLRKQA